MTVKKRKKVTRLRGSRTHGWGLRHRGSGQRGGAGFSGTGKKAGTNLPSSWKAGIKLGKEGFKSKGIIKVANVISLKDLEDKIPAWLNEKKISAEKGFYVINLKGLGYDKLLSTGRISKKVKVAVDYASKNAVEKLKSAGGEIVLKGG